MIKEDWSKNFSISPFTQIKAHAKALGFDEKTVSDRAYQMQGKKTIVFRNEKYGIKVAMRDSGKKAEIDTSGFNSMSSTKAKDLGKMILNAGKLAERMNRMKDIPLKK